MSPEASENPSKIKKFYDETIKELEGKRYILYCKDDVNRYAVSAVPNQGLLINDIWRSKDYFLWDNGTTIDFFCDSDMRFPISPDEMLAVIEGIESCNEKMDDETIQRENENLTLSQLMTLFWEMIHGVFVHGVDPNFPKK